MIIGPSYIGLKGWPVRGPCGPIMIEIGQVWMYIRALERTQILLTMTSYLLPLSGSLITTPKILEGYYQERVLNKWNKTPPEVQVICLTL